MSTNLRRDSEKNILRLEDAGSVSRSTEESLRKEYCGALICRKLRLEELVAKQRKENEDLSSTNKIKEAEIATHKSTNSGLTQEFNKSRDDLRFWLRLKS